MDKTLKGKCMDCGKEYMYSPIDRHSIVKSRWVRSARFCGLECFNKAPKKMQDTIIMYEYLNNNLKKVKHKRKEREKKQMEKQNNYL